MVITAKVDEPVICVIEEFEHDPKTKLITSKLLVSKVTIGNESDD